MTSRLINPLSEHNWHWCPTPERGPDDPAFEWYCPTCEQVWIWRRPPRPPAQWIRREEES